MLTKDWYRYTVYTNAAGAQALAWCVEAAELLGVGKTPRLWKEIAYSPYLPLSESLFSGGPVHLQDATYTKGTRVNQAAVALLQYPLGLDFGPTINRNDLDYYASVTKFEGMFTGDTSYSCAYLALGNRSLADQTLELAFKHINPHFDVFHETAGGGTQHFVTGSGGYIQGFVFGYSGMRIARRGVLSFAAQQPVLPPLGVTSVTLRGVHLLGTAFNFQYNSSTICVGLTPEQAAGQVLELRLLGGSGPRTYTLTQSPVCVALGAVEVAGGNPRYKTMGTAIVPTKTDDHDHAEIYQATPEDGRGIVPPIILSVSPSQLPTTGNATILVHGSGFATGRPASCRLASATPGTAWTHAGYAGKSDLRLPATVINDSLLSCVSPAVLAPGPGVLSVATNCNTVPCVLGNWGQHVPWRSGLPWAEPARVMYFTLVDATVGRRPYINETTAELLIATHASLLGVTLAVSAFLPNPNSHGGSGGAAGSSWSWSISPQNGSDIVFFPLQGLPVTINADLHISVTGPGFNWTRWRRFQRAPPLRAGSRAVPVVVDHHTRSLQVGGALFLGLGWYLGLADWNGTEHVKISPDTVLAVVRTQAALGVNQVLVLESQVRKWSDTELLDFMDGCDELGVKVLHPMMSFGTGGGGPNAVNYSRHWDGGVEAAEWEAQILGNVTLLRDHPALLGFAM
jgi:hypothetical protein